MSAQKHQLLIHVHDFQPGLSNSQLKCGHAPVKQCIATNISLRGQSLIINNPAIYKFPQNFLSLGGRINTSFYKMAKIDSTQTIDSGNPFQMAADYITDRVAVIGTLGTAKSQNRFINRLLDLYIPLDSIFKSEDPKNQKIHSFLDINPSIEIDPFLKSITNESYNTQMNTHTAIFDKVILGLQKFDNFDMNYLSSPYTEKSLTIPPGLLRSHFSMSKTDPRLITVLLPPEDKIVNLTRSLETIKSKCTKCNIQIINYSSLLVQNYINTISKSKILIAGRYYGSELSYFMNPGSILLELSQNMFDCDERSKLLAQAAGVAYYNLGSSVSYDWNECKNNCNSQFCLELVSSMKLYTEPAMFNAAWDVSFKQIQES
ncbi:hypothetical protein TVAG_174640 [Trichomonas vaginalis G3]|uniref:Uncharacterized protein n=1 Tax=Trichomonas vaginalis (strain ATCC PRA-98 / G3) TaxID=412133 RepID=A2EK11_TRIV3|nr:hypothetical protein TVAGG3_0974430 [Trichomonas vaginalis G3]EAY06995.1 hypothetical protein TVAG_174640 [Trichomonas vaginalis G3]KAI5488825.1 hypothetical protein TVAGG3_0974430 [Trichomonas vaginalis G3]|eukprot:XP_001319218.1 hypothetical protein [Trichomonas vaginalis G3]